VRRHRDHAVAARNRRADAGTGERHHRLAGACMTDNTLLDLFWTFARLSVVSVGGVNSSMSEIIRQVVDVHAWITRAQLADAIALAQASPGPNGLVVA